MFKVSEDAHKLACWTDHKVIRGSNPSGYLFKRSFIHSFRLFL